MIFFKSVILMSLLDLFLFTSVENSLKARDLLTAREEES